MTDIPVLEQKTAPELWADAKRALEAARDAEKARRRQTEAAERFSSSRSRSSGPPG